MQSTKAARVLVVDDHQDVARTMCVILEVGGHACTTVFSGEDALERCFSDRFDCMFLDYQMGAVSGLDVALQLANEPTARPKRIVMLSAQSADLFAGALTCGFVDAVLSKPADLSAVLGQVALSTA